jgi:hypothetical protein
MKLALLLLTSSLVIAASGASAQGNSDACHNQFAACVERCATRPQSRQEKCSQTCEANTNQCYSGMYGQPSAAQTLQTAPAQEAETRDEAKTEAKAEAKPKKKKKQ